MEFEVFGIQADRETRDAIYYNETKQMELYEQIACPCVILVTCHRFEIYSTRKIDPTFLIEPYQEHEIEIYTYSSADAYRHLLEVCCGLCSQIFGEDEILHQVKQAYTFACLNQPIDTDLHHLFQEAFRCAKEVKRQYKISEHPLSLSYIAYQEMKKQTDLNGAKVLVIGSGEIAKQICQNLNDEPIEGYLVSRTLQHALDLTDRFPRFALLPYEERYEIAKKADIIISATAAPHPVLKRFDHKPTLLAFDLASPSDIEPQGSMRLYTLDTLAQISKQNQQLRLDELDHVRAHIETYVDSFLKHQHQKEIGETIDSLQQLVETICEDTYHYLEHKLAMNEREKQILKKSLRASLFRLIKTPIHQLKEDEERFHETIKVLFDLERVKHEN